MPTKPASVAATVSGNSLKNTVSEGGKTTSFSVSIQYPISGSGPSRQYRIGGANLPVPDTVATITYQNFEMAADNGQGKGKFCELYGSSPSAGGMIAAARGVDHIIDALGLAPEAKINPERVCVTECSRNGKRSMIAGAFIDRIALALPQEGGQSAVGCWRIADEIQRNGTKVETAHQIVNGDTWCCFGDRVRWRIK